MTKAAILRCIEEMESKLGELRAAVKELPEATEERPADALIDLEQEEAEEEANDLSMIFATLRTVWGIPPDVKPDMPLEELQQAMAEGLPENWASRELMRLREE
jgi:outer membrane protein TolC